MPHPGAGWSQVEIRGKPADIFVPQRPAEHIAAVLFLHGHGAAERLEISTLRDNAPYTAELEARGLHVICPHGARAWWLDRPCGDFDPRVTPQAHLREAVLPWLAETWAVRPPAIALMGVSMGGQGALQLAYRFPREFPSVAALAPAIDFQNCWGRGLPLDEMFSNREAARQATAILHLNPLNWPRHQLVVCDPADAEWFESADRLVGKLSSIGIPFEADLETTHGGHSWEYFNHMAPRVMEFLAASLEQERRRVG